MRAEIKALRNEGVYLPAQAVLAKDEWKRDIQLAADENPALITAANAGIPFQYGNIIDPKVISVILRATKFAEVFGEAQKGDWTTLTAQFPLSEVVGQASSYGDYSNGGAANVNVNWISRQAYTFQTTTTYGEREAELYGKAGIGYAALQDTASATILNRFLNRSYAFGIAGLQNYGALNDPSLPAAITPATKVGGGSTWANATAQEIYNDVLALFTQLQTQLAGNVPDSNEKLTLVLSNIRYSLLKRVSIYNVSAEQTIRDTFPNIKIATTVEHSTVSGELMQLKLDEFDGVPTAYGAFTVKLRAHAVVSMESAWKQKKSAGTWGMVILRPVCIAQMLGI